MDETVVFELYNNSKEASDWRKKVATSIGGPASSMFTLSVSIAIDGTKQSHFVIFEKQRGGKIEKSVHLFPGKRMNG